MQTFSFFALNKHEIVKINEIKLLLSIHYILQKLFQQFYVEE
jgi:hypothetical protein